MKGRLLFLFPLCLALLSCGNEESHVDYRPSFVETTAGMTLSYHEEEGGYFIDDYQGSETALRIPEKATGEAGEYPIVGISKTAFYHRENLKAVALSEKVRYVAKQAFAGSNIEELYVTGHLTHAEDGFLDGSKIKLHRKDEFKYLPGLDFDYKYAVSMVALSDHLALPEGCEAIGKGLFSKLYSPHEVQVCLPYTDENGNSQQACMVETETFGQVALPSSIHYIGPGNFDGKCKPMITAGTEKIVLYDAPDYTLRNLSVEQGGSVKRIEIEEGVTSIGEYAFANAYLEELILPASIKTIGAHAFDGSYIGNHLDLSRITSIEDRGFVQTTFADGLTYPKGEVELGAYPFGNASVSGQGFVGNLPKYWELFSEKKPGSSKVEYLTQGSVKLTITPGEGYVSALTADHLPNITSIDFQEGIETIGMNAFNNCTKLTQITLPASLKTVKSNAFSQCNALTSIRYRGKKEQWNTIVWESGNGIVQNGDVVFEN